MVRPSRVKASDSKDPWSIVEELFLHAMPGFWWRLMPEKGRIDDISYTTSVEWEDIYSLFIGVKILEKRKVMGIESIFVKTATLDTLATKMQPTQLQITTFRVASDNNRSNSYYFCVGAPIYPVIKHFFDAVAAGLLIPGPATKNDSLCQKCRDAAKNIRELEMARETEQEKAQETELECENETEQANGQEMTHESEQDNLLLLATTILEHPQQQQNKYIDVLDWEKEQIEDAISYALELDFDRIPRYVRGSKDDKEIEINPRNQFTTEERALILLLANKWGYEDPSKNCDERKRIGLAACYQMAFDCGYKKPYGTSQLPIWQKQLENAFNRGEPTKGLQKEHKGSEKYLDKIEKTHPGYVRALFRYAQAKKGSKATFDELVEAMKAKSADPKDPRPALPKLDRKKIAVWFKENKGVFRSVAPRPLLSNAHKEKRVNWARTHFDKMRDETAPVAFLDEKWFYTESRRKKAKQLPSVENENVRYDPPKIVSRQHPIKVMYLGVVARPTLSKGFDGRVFMKRVSRFTKYKRTTRKQQFHNNDEINRQLTRGAWKDLYRDLEDVYDDMTVADFFLALSEFYELREEVADYLELRRIVGNKKESLGKDDHLSAFDINKLELNCCYPVGHEVEEDVSCDSKFMLDNMDAVGRALREKFHWVDKNEKVYLVMDNAGGHGTNLAKETYRQDLEEKYNIEIIWQVPRSPETNMLDLGVWMSIQNKVEKVHRGNRPTNDVLAQSVMEAWDNHLNPTAFENVWRRLRVVLKLIVDDKGGNNLVEKQRGKLYRDPTLNDAQSANNEQHSNDDNDNNGADNNNNDEATADENET